MVLSKLFYTILIPGDKVEWKDNILQVIQEDRQFRCQYCFFYEPKNGEYNCNKSDGRGKFVCSAAVRGDGINVIFKLLK